MEKESHVKSDHSTSSPVFLRLAVVLAECLVTVVVVGGVVAVVLVLAGHDCSLPSPGSSSVMSLHGYFSTPKSYSKNSGHHIVALSLFRML